MGAEFYVYDYDSGEQLSDEICGCLNAFSTFNQALKICKKYPENIMVDVQFR